MTSKQASSKIYFSMVDGSCPATTGFRDYYKNYKKSYFPKGENDRVKGDTFTSRLSITSNEGDDAHEESIHFELYPSSSHNRIFQESGFCNQISSVTNRKSGELDVRHGREANLKNLKASWQKGRTDNFLKPILAKIVLKRKKKTANPKFG
eukprot:CAMPEP_0178907162 /NCGR_PEP_ID=MMETSP0786-20121207/7219_1 /TAXON_ID=186022 /ORGANISM="Thalassionema frauenfeldii, Strain CCMP 1798" /LENGTH=150 /DNA_ID=CAMNT_0020578933 /DNA_START=35 /DNA_END=487 /DNA_ORIENTATION=-